MTGAASDHPVGLDALEGAYLKAVWLRMGDAIGPTRTDPTGDDEEAEALDAG